MTKRAVLALGSLVSLALVSSMSAGELAPIRFDNDLPEMDEANLARTFAMDRSDVFGTVDAASLIEGLPALELLDGHHLPIEVTLARAPIMPQTSLAFATVTAVPKPARTFSNDDKDMSGAMTDNRGKTYDMGGEVGLYYGRSVSGNQRGDAYGAYIVGGIGNDKIQVTGGISHEEMNFRWNRPRP